MDTSPNNPASPLTEAQIAHAADLALGLTPPQPVPQTPTLARLTTILDTLRRPALDPAPESLITRLVRLESKVRAASSIDRAADAVTAGLTNAVRSILATLTFDSRVSPALAGFRGSASAIQLAFASEAGDVHLQIAEPDAPDTLIAVRGAFEPADATEPAARSSASAEFVLTPTNGQGPATRGDLDEDLMFTLRVPPGTYRATLRRGSHAIDLGDIQVP